MVRQEQGAVPPGGPRTRAAVHRQLRAPSCQAQPLLRGRCPPDAGIAVPHLPGHPLLPDKRPFKTHVGIHFSHGSGKDAHAPVFYLHLEPENCFAAAGVWHPDNRTLTRIRTVIVEQPEQWAKMRRKLRLEGDSLTRPPRGYDPEHPFIEDIKRKDFVASVAFAERQVCAPAFLGNFAAACRSMVLLVEFTTRALGLKF